MCKRDLKTGLLICLLLQIQCLSSSAIERISAIGARESAMANAVVALPGQFSIFQNQAFLAEEKFSSISLSFRQPWFIKGYHESALSLIWPISTAVLALGVAQSAVATYNETSVSISMAKKLTRRLSGGICINYFFLNLPETGRNTGSFQVDCGLGYKHSRRLSLGLHLRNCASTVAETYQYHLVFPLVIRGGASCRLSEHLLLASETAIEKYGGVSFRLGFEFKLVENFVLRGGLTTNPFQHSFGFGYLWRFCQLDFALVHHEILGYSPLFSINFNLNR
ncbi:MAG: hypothetical protein M0Q53_01865 [Prolixibacteraceae bacterium]|jgi:hypothetical protein|nr:hypothetical protein [Prolixibacteraceae bacterium]